MLAADRDGKHQPDDGAEFCGIRPVDPKNPSPDWIGRGQSTHADDFSDGVFRRMF
jgi:hypothetical protein